VITVASALVLACAQFWRIALALGDRYSLCVDAARGVIEGRPHWRIYQSRVLAPYAVDALAAVTRDFTLAHAVFSIGMLVIAGLLAYRIGARVGGPRRGALALVAFHALFALVVARPWLYGWDFVDAVVFLVFVDFVLAERPWPWILALAALGSLNHEVAAFIALWVTVDAALRRTSWRQALAGVACFAAILVAVELVRGALLVEELGPTLFPDAPRDIGGSFHFAVAHNLTLLHRMFSHVEYATFAVPAILALAIASGARLARRFPALVAVHVLLLASLLVFGAVSETRIYIVLIPLVVLAAVRADMS
jgi:hypothetical protein